MTDALFFTEWASQETISQLLNQLSTGIVVHGPDTKILFANPAALRMLKLDNRIQGKVATDPIWQFLTPDGSLMAVEDFPVNLVIDAKKPVHNYVVGIRFSDSPLPKWWVIDAFPILNADGEISQVIVSFVDTTDHKRNEDALRQRAQEMELLNVRVRQELAERTKTQESLSLREHQLRLVTDNIPISISLIRASDLHYQFVNMEVERGLGIPRQQIVGKSVREVLGEVVFGRIQPYLQRALTGESVSFIHAGKPALKPIFLQVSYIPDKNEAGEVQALVAVSYNITELLAAEAEVRRNRDELARSNAELQQFAYVVSHDLQEPLRMVSSYLQLLARRYVNQLDKDAQEFIRFAVDGSQRMHHMIQALVTYSRVNTHGQPFEAVDLESVLADALANLQVAMAEAQAEITHIRLPVVQADPAQMLQLLQNLLGNALKFRGQAPACIHIDAQLQESDRWRISIQDSGIGIDPDYQSQIFTIFRRLHTQEEYPGTGIGLSICKRILDRQQGEIWVESAPGQGATFYFTLRAV